MRTVRAALGRSGRRRARFYSAILAATLLAAGCGVFGDDEKPVIRLYDGQHDSIRLNNAIAEFIIGRGYGYPLQSVFLTTLEMEEALPQGAIDLNLEGWQQNISEWYEEQIARGTIVNLGMTYEAGPQFFMVPRWVAEEYGIRTVFDLQDHWELFEDPEDPSKGALYNCTVGSQCTEINKVKLEAYGLARYFNAVSPASYASLAATLASAQDQRRPILGYYWAPTALMGAYDWQVLEEPPYSDECWRRVIAAATGESASPEQACAYETLPIDALAYSGLEQKAPDVVEMMMKMNVGLEPLNQTLAWSVENGVTDAGDWERAAVHYLQTFEDRWRTWVTPKAAEKIEEALEEAAAGGR
jgi:glycine betaine/proline transport system substrate-binding protein